MRVSCPLCKSTQTKTKYYDVNGFGTSRNFDIIACPSCQLSFTYPILSEIEQKKYYDEQSIAFNGVGDSRLIEQYKNNRQSYWEDLGYIKRLKEVRTHKPSVRRVLDIGCGAGIFLDCLGHNDYEAMGLELSQWGYAQTQKLGLNVKNQRLSEYVASDPQVYDVITMYDVLEHSNVPDKELVWASKILAPGGILIINLPNINSVVAKMAGPTWTKLIPPNHTYHFTKAGLEKLVKSKGFDIKKIYTNHGSPKETAREISGGLWRLPAALSPKLDKAYRAKDFPLNGSKHPITVGAKATQKAFGGFYHWSYAALPLIGLFGAGEGIHLIASKP